MKFGTGHPRGLVLSRWSPDLNRSAASSFHLSLLRTVILRTPSRVTVHQSCFDANVHDRQPSRGGGANRAGSLCNAAMQLCTTLLEKGLASPLCELILS